MPTDSNNIHSEDTSSRRFRSAPLLWQNIIKSIVTDTYDGRPITYSMIEAAVSEANHSISRESLRVKMARYKKSGYVKSAISKRNPTGISGSFWVTEKGKVFFGLKKRQSLNEQKNTAMLPISPSRWGIKFPEKKPH